MWDVGLQDLFDALLTQEDIQLGYNHLELVKGFNCMYIKKDVNIYIYVYTMPDQHLEYNKSLRFA